MAAAEGAGLLSYAKTVNFRLSLVYVALSVNIGPLPPT